MQVPEKLKIGGFTYTISLSDTMPELGTCNPDHLLIKICNNQPVEKKMSNLLHEIIEAINYIYDLDLEHTAVKILDATLYQVLKDNKLKFFEEKEK